MVSYLLLSVFKGEEERKSLKVEEVIHGCKYLSMFKEKNKQKGLGINFCNSKCTQLYHLVELACLG